MNRQEVLKKLEQKKEKRTLHYSMQDIDDACYYHKGDDPLYRWMFVCDDSSEHQETVARAWLDGYEVEEEQRWAVKLKFGRQYLSENADGTAIDFYSFMFPVRSYTKKELEAVEDGAFYKIDGDKEWINPIIELIPAEEV